MAVPFRSDVNLAQTQQSGYFARTDRESAAKSLARERGVAYRRDRIRNGLTNIGCNGGPWRLSMRDLILRLAAFLILTTATTAIYAVPYLTIR